MTLGELFEYQEEVYPSQYSKSVKLVWVNKLEHEIIAFLKLFDEEPTFEDYTIDTPDDTETLLDEMDMYALYISAKSDFANGEYARFNNKLAQVNALFDDYKRRYAQNHETVGVKYIYVGVR